MFTLDGFFDLLLSPLVLAADLIFFLGSEVVLNVEGLANLFGRLALDHVGDSLATNIEKSLDIQVVRSKNDLEEHLLVDLHELLVPLFDVGRLLARVGVILVGGSRVGLVVVAPVNDLLEHGRIDVGNRNWIRHGLFAQVADHVLDQD